MTISHASAPKTEEGGFVVITSDDPCLTSYLHEIIEDGKRYEVRKNGVPLGAIIPRDDFEIPEVQERLDTRLPQVIPTMHFSEHLGDIYGQLEKGTDFTINFRGEPIAAFICRETLDQMKSSLERQKIKSHRRQYGLTVVENSGPR